MSKATATRLNLLQKAFELIYTKGYQTTSIDDILATTQVTKGAFYYHFKTKDEMGLAIIHEILKPIMLETFVKPLQNTQNPLKDIYQMIQQLLLNNPFLVLEYGCPAGNLTQEMTPWHPTFSQALSEIILLLQKTIQTSIEKGIQNGTIKNSVHAEQTTYFILSGYWGIRQFGKLYHNKNCYHHYLNELEQYLGNLEFFQ